MLPTMFRPTDWFLDVLYQEAGTAAPAPALISSRWPSSCARSAAKAEDPSDGISSVHPAAIRRRAILCLIFQQSLAIEPIYHPCPSPTAHPGAGRRLILDGRRARRGASP